MTDKMREEFDALKFHERHANAAESRYWCNQYKLFAQKLLDEQAKAFKGELQVYDGMVRELTKTVEDMRAAQPVPVVGEPVGWRWVDASGKPEGVCIFTGQPSGGAIRKAYELGYTHEFVIAKPTHSIPASELASLREKAETHALELRAYEATVQNLEQRIRQLEAERDGMALVPRGLLDKFPELNTSNYGPDDVDELNAWGIELVLAAAPQPKKEGSKCDSLYSQRCQPCTG